MSQSFLQKIKEYIGSLEKNDQNDYDAISCALSTIEEMSKFIQTRFDSNKIQGWIDAQDPTFDRFASRLKFALEPQRDYYVSIADQLSAVEAVSPIYQKISACQAKIDEMLEQEGSILKEIGPLFEKEELLRQAKGHLDELLARREELEGIEKQLAHIDQEALAADVQEKERIKQELETKVKPLIEARDSLESQVDDTREAIRNIEKKISLLEGAENELSLRLVQSIPEWIQKIKVRRSVMEEKDRKYVDALEAEMAELLTIETQVKDHLQRMKDVFDAAATSREIMRNHFQADRELAGRFEKSLLSVQDDIRKLALDMEGSLEQFDSMLKDSQQRIQAVADGFKPISL